MNTTQHQHVKPHPTNQHNLFFILKKERKMTNNVQQFLASVPFPSLAIFWCVGLDSLTVIIIVSVLFVASNPVWLM